MQLKASTLTFFFVICAVFCSPRAQADSNDHDAVSSASQSILRRKLQSCRALDDDTVRDVVDLFMENEAEALEICGTPLGRLDVSRVTNMDELFSISRNDNAATFNLPLRGWDTSSVTSMVSMFRGAAVFNQPMGLWNVNRVTNMDSMFEDCGKYNRKMEFWDVSSVTSMNRMFKNAADFRRSLNDWSVDNVADMTEMFMGARRLDVGQCDWGSRLEDGTLVADMFVLTSCAEQTDPIIPDGPFCVAC